MSEDLRSHGKIVPRPVLVTVQSCDGCPALILDRADTNCSASRSAVQVVGGAKPITPFWARERPAPSWCPAGNL
jgi:hypothetical protein